jgi:hypothetical protein
MSARFQSMALQRKSTSSETRNPCCHARLTMSASRSPCRFVRAVLKRALTRLGARYCVRRGRSKRRTFV